MGYGIPFGHAVDRKLFSGYTPPSPSSASATMPNGDAYVFGSGTLSGSYPDGITRLEGVPTSAEIRVLYRPLAGEVGDGMLVATTTSDVDGTWLVEGLDASLKFDVVCRKDGYNDMILSNVSPATD